MTRITHRLANGQLLRTMTTTLNDHFQHKDVESFWYCLGTGKMLKDIQSLP